MKLKFNFIEKGNDWYHKGFSSKGNPFHENLDYKKIKI